MMKPLTTSVYTFEKLCEGGFLYVDKTAGIHDLIEPAFAQYFLSRPRRFGKSLLISTLKVIFLGRRELFEGLALADKDYDWQTYPVIHLDMGTMASADPAELRQNLLRGVRRAAADNGCEVTAEIAYQAFEDLVNTLAAREGKVVILIDEYDKPLLGHLGQESARELQTVLKQFYAVIKTADHIYIFEFKLHGTAEEAMAQIHDKQYAAPYRDDPRRKILVGVEFNEQERNLGNWLIET